MDARLVAAALALLLVPTVSRAQQPIVRVPLAPDAPRGTIAPEPSPPVTPAPAPLPRTPPPEAATPPAAPATGETIGRVFCEQPVAIQFADRDAIAERYRPFVGIWSDAEWTPQICAALIVADVKPDGTASIVYVFGPMGSNARGPKGILQGTGIIRDGELKFQNSDGSQFAFRRVYADLEGNFTTPRGQSYQAIFKKTP
jgi:hypothetical protein